MHGALSSKSQLIRWTLVTLLGAWLWPKRIIILGGLYISIVVRWRLDALWIALIAPQMLVAVVRWLWIYLSEGEPGREPFWVPARIKAFAYHNKPTQHEVPFMTAIYFLAWHLFGINQIGSSIALLIGWLGFGLQRTHLYHIFDMSVDVIGASFCGVGYADILTSALALFYDYCVPMCKSTRLACKIRNSGIPLPCSERSTVLSSIGPTDWPVLSSLITVACPSPPSLLLMELPRIAPEITFAYFENINGQCSCSLKCRQ